MRSFSMLMVLTAKWFDCVSLHILIVYQYLLGKITVAAESFFFLSFSRLDARYSIMYACVCFFNGIKLDAVQQKKRFVHTKVLFSTKKKHTERKKKKTSCWHWCKVICLSDARQRKRSRIINGALESSDEWKGY